MKVFLSLLLLFCSFAGGYFARSFFKQEVVSASLQLTSSAFKDGDVIGDEFVCNGAALTPPFTISNVPLNTKSFALISTKPSLQPNSAMWILYNISPTIRSMPEGLLPGQMGLNHQGKATVIKPCSKEAKAKYVYYLFALDTDKFPEGNIDYTAFLNFTAQHSLEIASLSFFTVYP